MDTASPAKRGLTVYIAVVLTLIFLTLAGLFVLQVYAALKVKQESKTVSAQVNSFQSQVIDINKNLKSLNAQLQPPSGAALNRSLY